MPIHSIDARNLLIVLVAGAVACGSPSGDLGEYTDSDGSEDTTEGPGQTSGAAPTTTGDEPAPPSGASCEESSDMHLGWNHVVFEPDITGQEFAADCTVSAVQPAPAFVSLECLDRDVRIGLGDADVSQVVVGAPLALDYRRRDLSHYENWFTLRRTDASAELVVAGISATALAPPNAPEFFAPLHMTPSEGVCPIAPTCDSPMEKIAVEFADDGDAIALLPPSVATFGVAARYRLGVGEARNNHIELSDATGGCDLNGFSAYNYEVHVVLAPAE
ncbi:hypothetical protein [Nannocystis sp. SCPEA4]|uniref:hypothetical protein n=1 Tax=Nannocystis sp. SCPEA4 TaxID=2996787 RepID=UPI00227167A1|nr:hypothetical protein [Nannocystis sp. SCPEA4]MCY1059762.1 hypothetical protein [Nannocystis sp. SCPEA4]